MTLMEWWQPEEYGEVARMRVNGCLEAVITDREAREIVSREHLVRDALARVMPLVWLSMPVHDAELAT